MSNKTMINPNAVRPNQARIKKEEAELEELMGKMSSPKETAEEEVVEEETHEVEEEVVEKVEEKEEQEEENLSSEEKTFKKRYGDLRRHASKREEELKKRIEALEKGGKDFVPPKSEEDLEKWARKYPDVASIIESIAERKANEKFSLADERLNKLDEREAEIFRRSAEATITKAHPNFAELKEADEFHDWVADQPKWIKDALYENEDDPQSVIRVIDLYNVDKGLTSKGKKEQSRSAASAVSAGSKSTPDVAAGSIKFKESQVAKMSDSAFEKNWEQIQKDMQDPKFYDITGGAR